jgi:hypothetical protein
MSGLPRRNQYLSEQFTYRNGAPKEGTPGFYYLQNRLKEEYDRAYLDGVKFVLHDMNQRLTDLVNLDIEAYDRRVPLPDYAEDLKKTMKGIMSYLIAIRAGITNPAKFWQDENISSIFEWTVGVTVQAEKMTGSNEPGTIANRWIPKKENQVATTFYKDNWVKGEATRMQHISEQLALRDKYSKEIDKIKRENSDDPTDLIYNETTEVKEVLDLDDFAFDDKDSTLETKSNTKKRKTRTKKESN